MLNNIERHTKWTLFYITRAIESVKQGEDPTIWLANAIKNGADLGKDYYLNYMTDAEKDLDFKKIYQKAMVEVEKELKDC